MGHSVTLGGDRLGSGQNQQIYLDGYHSSNHNLGYVWRSSMTCGTLIPFMKELMLPGDNFDINLRTLVKTLPTVGPLYGSFKMQLDVFFCPFRLYIGCLHNNRTGVGQKMEKVIIPTIEVKAPYGGFNENEDYNQQHVSPDSLMSYLGINGYGHMIESQTQRNFNGIPFLAYYDIFKNYYSNKQEKKAFVISTYSSENDEYQVEKETNVAFANTDGTIKTHAQGSARRPNKTESNSLSQGVSAMNFRINGYQVAPNEIQTTWLNDYAGKYCELKVKVEKDGISKEYTIKSNKQTDMQEFELVGKISYIVYGENRMLNLHFERARNVTSNDGVYNITIVGELKMLKTNAELGDEIKSFPLEAIDETRELILSKSRIGEAVKIGEDGDINYMPYITNAANNEDVTYNRNPMNGLLLRTYLSDLYNNWVRTEWIEQANAASAIQVDNGSFSMDALIIAKRVWNYLNRVGVSGGTYQDWQEATWGRDAQRFSESPIYMGGASCNIDFDEVISNSATSGEPLGTLAGRGTVNNFKGGEINVKAQEAGYVIGIVSIVPRVDYYQGNDWDMTEIKTMYDLHKPEFDRIGFQDLITERMAAWSTTIDANGNEKKISIGKQPAWVQYMSKVNQIHGSFAQEKKDSYMVITRQYEPKYNEKTKMYDIKNATTYVFPQHYNYLFAAKELDIQPFWVQIGVDVFARRIMSAAAMPEL